MRKVKHQEEEDLDAGAVLVVGAALAGLGLWAWRRKKAQVARPAFALVPRESQDQDQGMILPRGDFMGPRRRGTDKSEFGFCF